MIELFADLWPLLVAATHLVVGATASAHVVLNKEDTRAAIGWVGIIWLTPLLGSMLYVVFGVNRIRARALALRAPQLRPESPCALPLASIQAAHQHLEAQPYHLNALARVVAEVTQRPLLPGNAIEPLVNGDEAFPAMLTAIDQAQDSVNLSSYIFDNDRAGRCFLEALQRAVERGIEVRVLIDDVGARYTWPPIVRALRKANINAVRFLPTLAPWKFRYSNLRSHRKIMVVDSRIGFTGGMNIREGNLLALNPSHPVKDLHFRITGPVVAHLQEAFAVDWAFCTEELLRGRRWFPSLEDAGPTLARGISDGPDEDYDKLRTVLLAAIGCAQHSLLIMTPYFLPDVAVITALNVAALRGVDVNIVLPEENNLTLVQWASTALYCQVLTSGCKIWLSPPPFEHTKLMVVDRTWLLLGSANWDPRSLRLNFEFNVECYDAELAGQMADLIENRIGQSQAVTAEAMQRRHLLLKLRDGVVRLASPYL